MLNSCQSLLHVDTDEYDGRWELNANGAMAMLYGQDRAQETQPLCSKVPSSATHYCSIHLPHSSNVTIIDLRSSQDFDDGHIPSAISTPLTNLTAATPSPFDDVDTLQDQWTDLKAKCKDEELGRILNGATGSCMVLCYNGETSRLATAVMRVQGVEAYSVKGGMAAIQDL